MRLLLLSGGRGHLFKGEDAQTWSLEAWLHGTTVGSFGQTLLLGAVEAPKIFPSENQGLFYLGLFSSWGLSLSQAG